MKLSVIIATCARPASLHRLLDSLNPQLSGRHELLIAENGTPAPSSISTTARLIHLHQIQPGKCAIQNRALAMARGELLVFLDDDLTVAPGYLGAVEHFFDSFPQFAAMKGRIVPAEDPVAKAGALAPYLDLPLVDHGDKVIEVRGVLGANMAFRAAALRQAGLFDERLGPGAAGHEEETDMSQRLRRAGFHIGYAPAALVHHEVDAARASRERFIRIARERGYCRTLHERHTRSEVLGAIAIARMRLLLAMLLRRPLTRVAREEGRLAVAQGLRDGVRLQAARLRSQR